MSINIPNKEQWAKLNEHLNNIAGVLGTQVDVPTTWAGVQKAVRAGIAPNLFPVGTQLVVNHSVYGEMVYDVVAHDYFKSVKDENAHTMTLMSRDIIEIMNYDEISAFCYARSKIPAGTYNFMLKKGIVSIRNVYCQFTLTQPVPQGGQLCFSHRIDGSEDLSTVRIYSYVSRTSTDVIESCSVEYGNEGTSLESIANVNGEWKRVPDYVDSDVRQFLNSSAEVGSVWSPKDTWDDYDRIPTWSSSKAGFMNGLDSDFLAVVGEVIVSIPNSYPEQSHTDKIYLLSYIDDLMDFRIERHSFWVDWVDLIKYVQNSNTPADWMLRDVNANNVDIELVSSNGRISSGFKGGVVPVCNIV